MAQHKGACAQCKGQLTLGHSTKAPPDCNSQMARLLAAHLSQSGMSKAIALLAPPMHGHRLMAAAYCWVAAAFWFWIYTVYMGDAGCHPLVACLLASLNTSLKKWLQRLAHCYTTRHSNSWRIHVGNMAPTASKLTAVQLYIVNACRTAYQYYARDMHVGIVMLCHVF